MASSKRRQKARAERAQRRASKFARFAAARDTETPNPDTKYGARWWARRRGEGANPRSHEQKPWFYSAVIADFARGMPLPPPPFRGEGAAQ